MSEDPAATSGDGRGRSRPTASGSAPGVDAPLDDWLGWIDAVHPSEMELGLARVTRVAGRLGLRHPPMPVVIVGGTNGKGSTVAMLEAIWSAAGYRTGAATSPHVSRFAERMRVGAGEAADADIVRALARVDRARYPSPAHDADATGSTDATDAMVPADAAIDGGGGGGDEVDTLTYFEFATLASMVLFVEAGCDVAIMEVGLGGRLDAVNLWDADCAVLTSVALDHADWLGTDLSVIATEKAAIGRAGRPLIVGEPNPPASLAAFAEMHGIDLVDVGGAPPASLPGTSLPGEHQRRNAGCALAAVRALAGRLPVEERVARAALARVALVARFEERTVDGVPLIIDVAHNPAAAEALAAAWRERFGEVRGIAVFAALADKDVEGVVRALAPVVGDWRCGSLEAARALPLDALTARVRAGLEGTEAPVRSAGPVADALSSALADAAATGRPVLVSGCFGAVTAAHAALGR